MSSTAQVPRRRRGGEISRTPFVVDSAEGLPIRGSIDRPAKARALVVLLHGFKGFRRWGFFPWLSEQLNHSGAATCTFDFSRNGVGADGETLDRLDLFADDTYSVQLDDLRRVFAFIEQQPSLDHLPITILGYSRGGAVAILGSSFAPRLKSVATWSSIANLDRWDDATLETWRAHGYVDVPNVRTGQMMRMSLRVLEDFERNRERYDVCAAVRAMQVPLLLLHGKSDETVHYGDALRLAQENDLSSVCLIPGGSHTFGAIHPLINVPPQLLLAARITSRFILGY